MGPRACIRRCVPSLALVAAVLVGGLATASASARPLRTSPLHVSAAASSHTKRARSRATATLEVRISGLPMGASAAVVLHGPSGLRKTLRRTSTLHGLPLGSYYARTGKVDVGGIHGLPAGSLAFPRVATRILVLKAHRRVRLNVMYGTIRSGRTKALSTVPVKTTGPPNDPSSVTVPANSGFSVGSIIAAAPSAALPGGLFDKVTRTATSGSAVQLFLAPALLSEAFPELDVEVEVPVYVGTYPPPIYSARTAGLSAFDLSFSQDLIPDILGASCGFSPTGWSFSPFGHINPTLTANLHQGFLGLPYGELSLTLKGAAGFDATIPSATHCDATVPGPAVDTFIPIAGIPVPVEGGVALAVSLSLTGSAHVHAQANVAITGGITLHGVYGTPILRVKPSASGSLSIAGGAITIGPEMQVGLGMTDINGHIADSLHVAAQGAADGSCEIDLGASAGLGFDIWKLHGSWNPIDPEIALYHCPTPTGGGGSNGGEGPHGGGGVPVNTAPPTIVDKERDGAPIIGDVLEASPGQWTGSPIEYDYTWESCTTLGACEHVPAPEASRSYELREGDLGRRIRVTVRARNSSGWSTASSSAATLAVAVHIEKPSEELLEVTPAAPTSGPVGLMIPFKAPPCDARSPETAVLALYVDRVPVEFDIGNILGLGYGVFSFFTSHASFVLHTSVGTHQLSFKCFILTRSETEPFIYEDRLTWTSPAVWRAEGFAFTLTGPQLSVTLLLPVVPILGEETTHAGAPAGQEPCPSIAGGAPWELAEAQVYSVNEVDYYLSHHLPALWQVSRTDFFLDESPGSELAALSFTIPDWGVFVPGTDLGVTILCRHPWNLADDEEYEFAGAEFEVVERAGTVSLMPFKATMPRQQTTLAHDFAQRRVADYVHQ